ncbi:MAG TPA: hypothetical protein VGZ52_03470 [Acidimicrobiales bacterium]|nr:hypothetical protein [Acidimicrobiales bacterium]
MQQALATAAGVAILVFTWMAVIFTIVMPRAQWGPGRLSTMVTRTVRLFFSSLARLTNDYERKDAILAPIGPVAVVFQLLVWLALFGLAFVLMLEPYTHNVWRAMSQVGAALFTLGEARSAGLTNDTIVTIAGATGLVVIGLQIAYLPSLYAAFNRREVLTTMLTSRAGEPAWGPEILIRHQLVGITDALPEFYGSWEQWSAEVSESHVSYPVLLLFRSPDPWGSWVISLLSVLDAAAMHLALQPENAPSQARMCLRMGYVALRRISSSLDWEFDNDPMPDDPLQLTEAEFTAAVALLEDVGFPIERDAAAAWPHFRGWRVNYEDLAYRWANRIVAPVAPWSGPRPGIGGGPIAPVRPSHRTPDDPYVAYERPEFPLPDA